MIFNSDVSKAVRDGDMIKKFMERYEKAKLERGNVGWNLIRQFPFDHQRMFCSETNYDHYFRLKFLENQNSAEEEEKLQ